MLSSLVILVELTLMAGLNLFGIIEWDDGYILVLIGIFSIAFLLDVKRQCQTKRLKFAFLGGYLFRIVLLMLDIFGRNIYVLPNSGADSGRFYKEAVRIAQGQSWDDMDISSFAGSIFRVIGVSRLYMQFLFLCFSIVALIAANDILKKLKVRQKNREITMEILCFLPNYAIMSVIFLRESTIAMCVAVSLWLFVRWFCGDKGQYFWLSFVPILFAATFHGGVIGVLMGYLLVRFFYNQQSRSYHFSLKTILPAVIAAFLLVFLFNNYGDVFFEKMQNMEDISDVGSTSALGDSTYAQYVGDSSNIVRMVLYSPIRIIFFQFSPFVWQIRGLPDVIAICFNGLFYLYVWYRTIRYMVSQKTKTEHKAIVIALFIIWFATTFVFAWGVTNVGTAVRHRDKMAIIGGVLLGLTMGKFEKRTKDAKNIIADRNGRLSRF